ncbi:MAG: flagellar FlbD family protein [Phycisphaerae bacterium]|nr:flagellar FlbD family protein [Phycisphaerae bacterium]
MIQLTRLNGKAFVLNAELIRAVEASSDRDTSITMVDGERLTVQEPVEEVVRRAVEYNRSIRAFR